MKISEIYAFTPIEIKHDMDLIIASFKSCLQENYQSHNFELESVVQAWEDSYEHEHMIDKNRYSIHMYMDESDNNGKYGARLFSIYFENTPIMLVKNNGRYFEDYESYLTNKDQLQKFVDYLLKLAKEFSEKEEIKTVSAEEEIADIEFVGDYNLFDFYNPSMETKYKEGDLVWGWVKENHLKYEFSDDFIGYVLTKVKINKVNKFNPSSTYYGNQCERGWSKTEDRSFSSKMQLFTIDEKFFGIGCELNDSIIVGKVDEIPMPKMAINNFVDAEGFLNPGYKMLWEDIKLAF